MDWQNQHSKNGCTTKNPILIIIHSPQRLKNLPKISFGNTKDHKQPRQYWVERATLEVITISDFKLYYRTIAIKTALYCHKNWCEDQWDRIEDPDMNAHIHTHLIFDKCAKNIQWRKDSLFNKCCWEKWLSVCWKLKLVPCLSPYTSINSKWIKDLNIRPKTFQLIHKRAGNTLETIGIGKDFHSRCQQPSN
jgi:hypothetical protein